MAGAHRSPRQDSDATRTAILDAASALFAERGYLATTVDDIAVAAHVATGTVYTNFGGKPQLLEAVVHRFVDPADADPAEPPAQAPATEPRPPAHAAQTAERPSAETAFAPAAAHAAPPTEPERPPADTAFAPASTPAPGQPPPLPGTAGQQQPLPDTPHVAPQQPPAHAAPAPAPSSPSLAAPPSAHAAPPPVDSPSPPQASAHAAFSPAPAPAPFQAQPPAHAAPPQAQPQAAHAAPAPEPQAQPAAPAPAFPETEPEAAPPVEARSIPEPTQPDPPATALDSAPALDADSTIRLTPAEVIAHIDARAVIRDTVHTNRLATEAFADFYDMIHRAGKVDTMVAGGAETAEERMRRSADHLVARLGELHALRTTPEQGIDLLRFFLGYLSWRRLVHDFGWSYDNAEAWLTDRIGEALLTGEGRDG